MGASEVSSMYITQAQSLEQQGKFKDAEKLYISVQESDLAISMYKKQRHYDQMMRLVQQYHPDLVQSTHIHLAQELEQEGNHRSAEKHFVDAGDWKSAVHMYRGVDLWEGTETYIVNCFSKWYSKNMCTLEYLIKVHWTFIFFPFWTPLSNTGFVLPGRL